MYKRTKNDSVLKCPYCGRQFTMNGRALDYQHEPKFDLNQGVCKHCGSSFFYVNVSAKYAREHGLVATYRIEFLKGVR